jgi:hypothetical protein
MLIFWQISLILEANIRQEKEARWVLLIEKNRSQKYHTVPLEDYSGDCPYSLKKTVLSSTVISLNLPEYS